MWSQFDDTMKARIRDKGIIHLPSDYEGTSYPVSWSLIEDGRDHLLLRAPLARDCPIHLFQGMADTDVPWGTALTIAVAVRGDNVTITLVKDGDHRLSRDEDISRLTNAVEMMAEQLSER